jgi:SNF2 family DNA or RNA helicase
MSPISSAPTGVPPRKSIAKIKDETQYWPHQIQGARTMARMNSVLLADEMGLGKSLQALTTAAIDFELGLAKRVLIVCPVTLKWNWRDEIRQHTKFSWMILDGDPDERKAILDVFSLGGCDILIVNYEQVVKHLQELIRLNFDIAILDEAHYIKNHKSKRTEAILELPIKRFFLLTGSPLLNKVNELWPLLRLIEPTKFPDYWRFVNRYALFGGWKGKAVIGTKNPNELQGHLNRVMIRRLKKDVLDLPEKQYIIVQVDMHPEQKRLYTGAKEDLVVPRFEGDTNPIEISNPMDKYNKMIQICSTTYTVTDEDHSFKLDRAVEMCAEFTHNEPDSPGEPIVIFNRFRRVQEAMRKRLEEEGITAFEIHGDVPKATRTDVVKAWGDFRDSNGRPGVLLVMLQVGGIGMNMTQANKCIFLNKLYVPKLNEQAEDRLHRLGADKTKPVQIYQIVVTGTVEHRVELILRRKEKLFNGIVDETEWMKALYEALQEEEDEVAA